MKIIDKYILRTFLVPLVFTSLAFLLIFVIYDLYDNLDKFIEAKAPVSEVIVYYLYLLPSKLWLLMPMAVLLSTLYSLFQLAKSNELTAMRASGISLYRLLVPNVLVGVLVAGLVFAINETIGPGYDYYCMRYIKGLRYADTDKTVLKDVKYNTDRRNWSVEKMNILTRYNNKMLGVTVREKAPNGRYAYILTAREAQFIDGKWEFYDATRTTYNDDGTPGGVEVITEPRSLNITDPPRELIRRKRQDTALTAEVISNVSLEINGRSWHIGQISTVAENNYRMEDILIKKTDENNKYQYKITADSAEFRQGEWYFVNTTEVRFNEEGGHEPMKSFALRKYDDLQETPAHFIREKQQLQYMTAFDMWTHYQQHKHNLDSTQRRTIIVDILSRMAQPFMSIVAVLLGMPFGFHTARKGVFAGILVCLGTFFTYYGLFITGVLLGKNGSLPPLVASWGPNLLFFFIGLILFQRMRQ